MFIFCKIVSGIEPKVFSAHLHLSNFSPKCKGVNNVLTFFEKFWHMYAKTHRTRFKRIKYIFCQIQRSCNVCGFVGIVFFFECYHSAQLVCQILLFFFSSREAHVGFLQTEEQKILSDAKSNCPTFYNLSLKTSCKTSTKATMRHAPSFKRNQREKNRVVIIERYFRCMWMQARVQWEGQYGLN